MSRKLTNEQFLERANRPCFKYLSEYKDAKTKIKTKCLLCGNIFTAPPFHLMDETRYLWGCPECNKKHIAEVRTLPYKDFVAKLPKKYDGWKFYDYIGAKKPITAECPKCGRTHKYCNAGAFTQGIAGCRRCSNWKYIAKQSRTP